jgi:glycosyltransferase involved in cell wall biosynthesis
MDTKNSILKKQIYTPPMYQQLLSIILVLNDVDDPLESLKNVIEQVYQPFEVIVINNSSDATHNILSNFILDNTLTNVQIFHSGSSNVYECLNIGLEKSLGHYIAFQLNEDRSSHLRFLYQINSLITQKLDSPQVSLCLSHTTKSTSIALKSMCFTRSVFNTIGYIISNYEDMCFEEYIRRYLVFTGKVSKTNEKTMTSIEYDSFASISVIQKVLLNHSDDKVNENRKTLITQYKNFHEGNMERVKFNMNEPITTTSYLDSVMGVLRGKSVEHRITLIYFISANSLVPLHQFYKRFQCNTLPMIICHLPEFNIEPIKLNKVCKDATFKQVESFADGYHKLMNNKNIQTQYTFILKDNYTFSESTLLHPLSYILDSIEKCAGDINSIRFSTETIVEEKTVDILSNPRMVYTTKFTDEPCILTVRHASMFFKPYIDKNGRGDEGVSSKLATKYSSTSIALKLRMCIYGDTGYPETSVYNEIVPIIDEFNEYAETPIKQPKSPESFLEKHYKRIEIKNNINGEN